MVPQPNSNPVIKTAPRGLAILAIVGPSLVWAAEYIGSGEVILATRTGAILGPVVIWAVFIGIFLKFWIGMSGARYTVCTGEGMIDMFARIPGPRNWPVWIVLLAQFASAAISIGSIAAAAGVFLSSMIGISPYLGGWIITVFCLAVAWSGVFNVLKMIMSFMVFIIVLGVIYVAVRVFPEKSEFIQGLLFRVPTVPDWAAGLEGVSRNPWREILPLLGWGAGGFASQVWYTYWVIGAGYGAANGRGYGVPADTNFLKQMTEKTARKIKQWCHVVYADAGVAMVIGTVVTVSFLIAGAGILGPLKIAPQGSEVAIKLSTIFSEKWGVLGGFLFMLAGTAALISTQIGQLSGWPRLLADASRICLPRFKDKHVCILGKKVTLVPFQKLAWKVQFRSFLLFFFCSNMIIVFTMGLKPVFLVKLGAILDGLLLTPLQALWVGIGLYYVLPKILSPEGKKVLRPHWIFAVGLAAGFIIFGYFCVFQMPETLFGR